MTREPGSPEVENAAAITTLDPAHPVLEDADLVIEDGRISHASPHRPEHISPSKNLSI